MQQKMLLKRHAGPVLSRIFKYMILTGLAFVIVYPFLVKLSIAFMDMWDLTDATVRFVPKNLTLDNFKGAIEYLDFWPNLGKTAVFTISISMVQVFFAMLTAYGLARFNFPGNRLLFGFVLLTLIVPPQSITLPLYFNFQSFDVFGLFKLFTGSSLSLVGKPAPLYILAAVGLGLKNGLLIFIFRQFFINSPKELEESASIDGAGVFKTFWKIIMPSAFPIILTAFLFALVWQWTDSFYTSIFMPDNTFLAKKIQMLASAIQRDQSAYVGTSNTYYISVLNNAGMLIFIAPILAVYFICQRYFIESIERTGIVG